MEVKIRRDEDAPESEAEGGTGETKSKNLTGKDRLYRGPWFWLEYVIRQHRVDSPPLRHKQVQMS